jgi:C1A family cysteine protease
MKLLIAGVIAVAAIGLMSMSTTVDDTESQFAQFVTEYRKSYFSQSEYQYRLSVFKENMAIAAQRDAEDTASHGITQFADWTHEEFMKLNGAIVPQEDDSHIPTLNTGKAPQGSKDWRTVPGVMTPTKDQGSCGSCWAFAAAETQESVWKLQKGELLDLSEQELVDCATSKKGYGNHGCSGGWYYWAWDYVKATKGMNTESEYPYHAKDETCKAQTAKHHEPISGYKKISGTSSALQAAIDQSPVAVAVDASKWSTYTGGVLSSCGTRLNHAVVAIGYETDGTWILRNSWGGRWGEQGTIRLAAGNTCGVLNKPYVPTV